MISNRSLPTDTVLPHIEYQDLEEALAWLGNAFGFVEHYRYGDPIRGAQVKAGDAWIMLNQAEADSVSPKRLGSGSMSLTIFIEDLEAHFERAKSAGVAILEELHETVYGELQYAAGDLDGGRWIFSRHSRDLSPDEWGATVSHAAAPAVQISPMLAVSDADAAVDFYQKAFGAEVLWRIGDDHIVAGLMIHGARFFLASEAPSSGTRSPNVAGFTTVRIELFVDDPESVHRQAVLAGAKFRNPVIEHAHQTIGPRPIRRMLQGDVVDPFGHLWLIGKILE